MDINATQFISPNFSDRKYKVDTVVIHSTRMTKENSLNRLCDKKSEVSCHYLIDLEGHIYRLVDEDKVAFHAGVSYWGGREKLNQFSLGIELVDIDHTGERVKSFTHKQMQVLIELIKDIIARYNISPQNIVAHSDIAPDRKDDPGEMFNWKLLADNSIGIFPKDFQYQESKGFLIRYGEQGEDVSMVQKLLSQYGYKISVDGKYGDQTQNVVIAFKRHFDTREINDIFDINSLAILRDIIDRSSKGCF